MNNIEEAKLLPKIVKIPPFYTSAQDYRDSICWKVSLLKSQKLYIEDSEGRSFIPNTAADLLSEAMRYSKVITFCPNNELDLIFRLFSKKQLYELDRNQCFRSGSFLIYQYSPTKITIRCGNQWSSIYNVYQLTTEELDTPLRVKGWLDKLNELSNFLQLNFNISSASSSTTTILSQLSLNIQKEFQRTKSLSEDELDLVYSTIHNTWMEPFVIGLEDNSENIDSIKAHLRAYGRIPSIRGGKSKLSTQPKHTPDALMGFYFVEFDYPNAGKTALAPMRLKQRSFAPYGLRTQYLPKPYLDKLLEMKIPFKVHKALEFLPVGTLEYPNAPFASISEKIIDGLQDKFEPINLRMLFYKTLIGSMQHIHPAVKQPEVLETPDDVIWETSKSFNLMVASTVYGMVNIGVFDQINNSINPYYRRHDGLSREPEDNIDRDFRPEEQGRLFILTSIYHDNPGSSLMYNLAHRSRDFDHVNIVYRNRLMGREHARNRPELIGSPYDYPLTLRPNPDCRLLEKPIKRLGAITEGNVKTKGVPAVEDIDKIIPQRYRSGIITNPFAHFEEN